MSTKIIVSYDGTANDDDALALGRMLGRSGVGIALAYVRHSREFDPRREELAQHDAERRLEQGAEWLGNSDIPRHIVISPSTGEGLGRLAEAVGASVIVFGSDYRTTPGHAEPGTSAQHLLEGGTVAIAVAAAGLRTASDPKISSIAVSTPDADTAATRTARAFAEKIGARLIETEDGPAELIVVDSSPEAPVGRVALSGPTRTMLDSAHGSVLVVPQGRPVAP
jgi:nucleotide-binding universal stress UspA family protein